MEINRLSIVIARTTDGYREDVAISVLQRAHFVVRGLLRHPPVGGFLAMTLLWIFDYVVGKRVRSEEVNHLA